jgi:hypothetical protein
MIPEDGMHATESEEQVSSTPATSSAHRSLRAAQGNSPSHQGSSSSPGSGRLWWPRHEDLEQIRAHAASHRPLPPVMVSKAGQLEAETLDQELTDMLKDQLGRVFSLLKPSVRHISRNHVFVLCGMPRSHPQIHHTPYVYGFPPMCGRILASKSHGKATRYGATASYHRFAQFCTGLFSLFFADV